MSFQGLYRFTSELIRTLFQCAVDKIRTRFIIQSFFTRPKEETALGLEVVLCGNVHDC